MEKGERRVLWDNMKGALMLLVVFGHILLKHPAARDAVSFVYMFHMPAFAFVSGYFGKSARASGVRAAAGLAVLYFIFNSVMGFVYGYTSLLIPVYSFWYLLSLIVWRLTAPKLSKFRYINAVLLALALFAGFFPSINNTLAVARTICFYPFYMAGYKLTPEEADRASGGGRVRYMKALGCLAGAGIVWYFSDGFLHFTESALQMGAYITPLDAFGRIAIFVGAYLMILFLRHAAFDKNVPGLSMIGRNSLWVFLLHRPVTILISGYIDDLPAPAVFAVGVLGAVGISLIFGNDTIAKYLNIFKGACERLLCEPGAKGRSVTVCRLVTLAVALGYVVSVVVNVYADYGVFDREPEETEPPAIGETGDDPIYPVLTDEQRERFDSALRITFAGDLILLEDQVKRAYAGDGSYDFAPVFEYAKKYIDSADYAIGVFEGPLAGGGYWILDRKF